MTRSARVTSLKDGLTQPVVAVLVSFHEGVGEVAPAIPSAIGQVEIPRTLSAAWCTQHGLKSDVASGVVLRGFSGAAIALLSVGTTAPTLDAYRLVGASAHRVAGDAALTVLLSTDGLADPAGAAQALVEGAVLASYRFKETAPATTLDLVPLGVPLPTVAVHDAVTAGVARGDQIGEAVNWVKRLVDTPGGTLPPKELARAISERLDDDVHVALEVWTESRIREERLGGLLGVGQGSAQPTRLVYATYDPPGDGPFTHVALVGKGITFDSGGLSIKPGPAMMAMKTDMTGAAIVMAVISLASRLRLRVKLTAIAPLAENLLGDKATKPGDVLATRNGMTIEVLNTDAEGRLVLADGLALAVEANPDAIIDVATLTGAQNVALGDEVGALFCSDDDLAAALAAASERSGERLWRMPLVDSYDVHIDSDFADVKNIGKPPMAGSIVAALLLRRFTAGKPWAHLDIAGPSRADAVRGYTTKGATAFTTRTLVEYLRALDDVVP